ncbi:unnamed protein product [Albugo candida]|uniref:Carbohydrate-binding domain-containing protein n=1 Tax=Albugo candida TaxID=65357 RepID=A0A024G9P8_9STRA|nr:unnamed protein product [Albugo candida]|eukprot:CCI43468.1 unnamed protein product [Albugo candida]
MSSVEWKRMCFICPPTYVCVRRQLLDTKSHTNTNTKYTPLHLDGRLDKDEWAHVEWSTLFQDIEGPKMLPKPHPQTRFKMMYDDTYLYIGAELAETQLWGTYTVKNSRMYDENDFEIFLNPDGTRHNYYELEMNCLNTIWELVLQKPYKDGHALENPCNLHSTESAVYLHGDVNNPAAKSTKWSIEVRYALKELERFDTVRNRPMRAGDIWRVNFSRVQYKLETVRNQAGVLSYEKKPNCREDNIVWAPTGVIDIHRPEKWGIVFFASDTSHATGVLELKDAQKRYLDQQLAIERVLDTIYYAQCDFCAKNAKYAESFEELQTFIEANSDSEKTLQYPIDLYSKLQDDFKRFAPKITVGDTVAPLSKKVERLGNTYCATISTATEEWSIRHDGKLWPTYSS